MCLAAALLANSRVLRWPCLHSPYAFVLLPLFRPVPWHLRHGANGRNHTSIRHHPAARATTPNQNHTTALMPPPGEFSHRPGPGHHMPAGLRK
jgi:hypothetical protein